MDRSHGMSLQESGKTGRLHIITRQTAQESVSTGQQRAEAADGVAVREQEVSHAEVGEDIHQRTADEAAVDILLREQLGRIAGIPVGDGLVGRVVDPIGTPLDGMGPVTGDTVEMPLERKAIEVF